jgi:hypothetical protein
LAMLRKNIEMQLNVLVRCTESMPTALSQQNVP